MKSRSSLLRLLHLARHPLAFAALATSSLLFATPSTPSPHTLWYRTPGEASVTNGLPVGNGRLGALVAGTVATDRLAVCEQTVWSGGPYDFDNPAALAALTEARRLLFAGDYARAHSHISRNLVCKWDLTERRNFGSYQVLAFLDLAFDAHTAEATDYRRELDLATATVRVSYRLDDTIFTREIFASTPDQVLAVRLSADRPGALSLLAALSRPREPEAVADAKTITTRTDTPRLAAEGADGHSLRVRLNRNAEPDGLRLLARLRAVPSGGTVTATEAGLRIEKADSVILYVDGSTDFRGRDPEADTAARLAAALSKSFPRLQADQVADHRKLFDRVALDLGTSPASALPLPERLAAVKGGQPDPALAALYFQFGRYLLISSSRPGGLPANLQGLWVDNLRPPWQSDYHTNINVQMNYWLAQTTNLAECAEPLADFIDTLVEPGSRTARVHYDAPGWTVHTMTNVWGYTSPGSSASWGLFPMGGPWLAQHLFEHHDFSGSPDPAFLRRHWPALRGAAEFILGWLVEDPSTGKLVSGPSNSPENRFTTADGTTTSFCMGPSMDQQIADDFLGRFVAAAALVGQDADLAARAASARARLRAPGIGSDGRLMEWAEEFRENDPAHRHVSHLFALHPGRAITPDGTPELARAARLSLEGRGDGGTGWSLAWKVNFWARLHDGDRAHALLLNLFNPVSPRTTSMRHGGGSYPNLFCAHPPMQIDGNFGGAAGIAELLLQSHAQTAENTTVLDLLPALPSAWPTGSAKGLRARGGFLVDQEWRDGRLLRATVTSTTGRPCRIRYRHTTLDLTLAPSASRVFSPPAAP